MQRTSECLMRDGRGTMEVEYPWAVDAADKALSVFWSASEIAVESDANDLRVNMTDVERDAVCEVLRLFTLYEKRAGRNYWLGRMMDAFQRDELQRLFSVFGMFELAVHAPFYRKVNELLNVDDDSFFLSYKDDALLYSRMRTIGDLIVSDSLLVSIAAMTFVEGAVLYSSFAFLKSFQSNGRALLSNTIRGINASVIDENIHAECGARLFNELKAEAGLSEHEQRVLDAQVYAIADIILKQEYQLIYRIFAQGDIDGITEKGLQAFAESRVDICLENLGLKPIYMPAENPIAEWFYAGIGFQSNDTFSGVSLRYVRDWDESRFTWQADLEDTE